MQTDKWTDRKRERELWLSVVDKETEGKTEEQIEERQTGTFRQNNRQMDRQIDGLRKKGK